MSTVFQWGSQLVRRAWRTPLSPRQFTNPNFVTLDPKQLIEEETIPGYIPAHYYPVLIGEVFKARYQVVGKLGYGTTSTVWLARDLDLHRHVALKVFSQSAQLGNELKMYDRLKRGSRFHRGRPYVRMALDAFHVSGPDGEHQCLVHTPMWDSVQTFLRRNPINKLPEVILRAVLVITLQALEYIHDECQIIHTDIKADNILFGLKDLSIFEEFEQSELQDPCPRKIENGRTIYTSRALRMPTAEGIGPPVLCDFGAAVCGKTSQQEYAQPDFYRAPEVILQVPWGYEIDVWNTGVMIWDIFENKTLFKGVDPEHGAYRLRAHLAEIIAVLGPPPTDLIRRAKSPLKYFDSEGNFTAGIDIPQASTISDCEENLAGNDKAAFIHFMTGMLQWLPEARKSPTELLEDPWLMEEVDN